MDSPELRPAAPAPAPAAKLVDRKGRPYTPAVGPRLKVLLNLIFAAVALLGASGVYLVAIRFLEWGRSATYTNQVTIGVFMAHVVVGVVLVVPFLFFGFAHFASARTRKNRLAVRLGIILFVVSVVVGLTGLALIQLDRLPQLPTGTWGRNLTYALHVLTPLLAVAIYVLHRRAGPDIQWRWGGAWGVAVGIFVVVMGVFHSYDPRPWYQKGPKDGETYYLPSLVHTAKGNFISAQTLMMDNYCKECHPDVYKGWFHSAHHFASFNNPAYLFSVRETRKMAMKRDGNTRPSRWCAGCHDVVPFLSGAFDNPDFDDVNDPTAHAGLTCTVCHAMTHIDSVAGNGAYTIEEPLHYPGATSTNPLFHWFSNQVVKAKPDFHKKTMLKPFHRSAEFCSTCHKVSLPMALNHYKEFLRGQNHYDSFILSGVSGGGSRSFYYPPVAKTRCAECHMPLKESNDFGSRVFDDSGVRKIHDHFFPGANTGLPALLMLDPRYQDHADGFKAAIDTNAAFLKDKKMRIDLFGLREDGEIDGRLIAPLRPELPALKPGSTYLVEVVLRTLGLGHHFPQGTADSNEIWVDFKATAGGKVIGRSGALTGPDETGAVDEWSHFVNVLMLDRDGHRINRRNPQDIFTPLYDHQIPPGAGQVVHYRLEVPPDVKGPIELHVRLRYRKFDYEYMALVHKEAGGVVPKLPIVDLCEDRVTLPVEGMVPGVSAQTSPIQPAWQRWNDYGIGYLLTAQSDPKKPGLRQAEEAFRKLLALDDKDALAHGTVNLARVTFEERRFAEAGELLNKVGAAGLPAPWWTVAWFTGLVNAQNNHLAEAIENFEKILDPQNQDQERRLDFTRDYVVINELGNVLFKRAQEEFDHPLERDRFLARAVEQFERTLELEPEDLDAHYGLSQCYRQLGEEVRGTEDVNLTVPADDGELRTLITDSLSKTLFNKKESRQRRLRAAVELGQALREFGKRPTQPNEPKLPVLQELGSACRALFREGDDADYRAAAAHVLGHVHREEHAIYIPDTNAKDRTVALHRKAFPAAAHASQTLVIYPTRREGAPGL
jgi:tetratricopeptide (TPR) repeat protein